MYKMCLQTNETDSFSKTETETTNNKINFIAKPYQTSKASRQENLNLESIVTQIDFLD